MDFKYKLIRKRGFSGSTSISISAEKGVVVRAPFWVPQPMIDKFVEQKADWIKKNLHHLDTKKITKEYTDGEKHLFLGKEYSLSINKNEIAEVSKVNLVGDYLQVSLYCNLPPNKHQEKIKEILTYWYLEKGIEIITEKVNLYSQKIGVSYTKISLKKVSSIWGSCSPSNCLSFNRKLVMAPHEIVDYVVIHEVAHLVHRNHGHGFWALVEKHDPQYKTHRKWLKLNHHLLSL